MNISPIAAYSDLYQVKYSKRQKNNKISFKNYSDSFRKAMTMQINNKKDVEQIFKNLIKSEGKSFAILDWFKVMYITYEDKAEPLFEILKNLYLTKKGSIATDSKGSVAYAQKDSIMFMGPERDERVEFILNKDKSIEFSRGDAYSDQIVKFFPNSDVKKSETKISGSGMGQVSETTYYNSDGSERSLRNFINAVFGL